MRAGAATAKSSGVVIAAAKSNDSPALVTLNGSDTSSCGAHIAVRTSSLCVLYTYEPSGHGAKCVNDKTLQMNLIDQQISGCWEFHGRDGRSVIEQGSIMAGVSGLRFGCRHERAVIGESTTVALRPGALDDSEEPLFDLQVLRNFQLPDLRRALSLETDDEFDSFIFEAFNYVSHASLARSASVIRNLRVDRIKRFIERHAFEKISLTDVAACVGLSPYSCLRQFKSGTGRTPLRYLNDLRLERARELLSTSRLSIGDIAKRVAIDDRLYFSRWFSKQTGMSPQRFRTIQNR